MNNTSMDFTSFIKAILEDLQEKLGEDYTVFSHSIKKNNSVRRTGIIARRMGQAAAPAVYVDGLYKEGIAREEIKKISNELYGEFQKAEFEEQIDLSGFMDYQQAKERLAFKLISAEKNKELLKTIPHKLFHDLAVVFYYTVQEAPFYGKAAILVHNQHMGLWRVNTGNLYEAAFKNTPKLFPGVIENMEAVMRSIFADSLKSDIFHIKPEGSYQKADGTSTAGKGCGGQEDYSNEDALLADSWAEEMAKQMAEGFNESKIPMYVMTNKQKLYGAACLLYPDMLRRFADMAGKDFYVLPSSVHEVILVPADAGAGRDVLHEIVTDINRTQVAEDEVLADSVYYYSRSKNSVLWLR